MVDRPIPLEPSATRIESMRAVASALRVPPTEALRRSRTGLLGDYIVLSKPRVLTMVLIAWAIGFDLGSPRVGFALLDPRFWESLLGLAAVAAGSSALNQALEHTTDRRMIRTASRPIAQGRIGLIHGLIVGLASVMVGLILIASGSNLLSSGLAGLACAGYVLLYTPLKRCTDLNILPGALFGALPPLIGWTAACGRIGWPGIALFAILFIWQIPHVIAIGWLNRDDYLRAGIRVPATSGNEEFSARSSAIWAEISAAIMIPVSLWPAWLHAAGPVYTIAAVALGGWYFVAARNFGRIAGGPVADKSTAGARKLLKVSVVYLPLLLFALILNAHHTNSSHEAGQVEQISRASAR